MQEDKPAEGGTVVGNRWPEAIVAVVLLALGAIVIVDSIRVGRGWADDGPESGYFTFYIGLLLMAASAFVLLQTLLRWRTDQGVFADGGQLKSVAAVLIPMTVYVAAIPLIGIYAASALLIGFFMRRHGKYGWPSTATVAVGVPLVIYFVFERWFLVLLPKGLVQPWLGL